jgi:hypothetical protein
MYLYRSYFYNSRVGRTIAMVILAMQRSTAISGLGTATVTTGNLEPLPGPDLNNLLLRCSELSGEIAQIRTLVRRLTRNESRQMNGRRSHKSQRARRFSNSDGRAHTRPVKSELERACRIALMEATEPMSLETIYDRIQRRGSYTFAEYRHPFRAMVLALNGMVKQGEVSLLCEEGHRCWRLG